jgi:hypothetical protein
MGDLESLNYLPSLDMAASKYREMAEDSGKDLFVRRA